MVNPDEIVALVREIPDWPRPGISFKDITPLLNDPAVFARVIDAIVDHFVGSRIDRVLGVEARGLIFASPVAYRLGAGFVPIRKPGKLPWDIEREEYALEYGSDLLEVHRDAIQAGERVLVVDDVLATGGTAGAAVRLVERLGGEVAGLAFVLELSFLGGREGLGGIDLLALASVSS